MYVLSCAKILTGACAEHTLHDDAIVDTILSEHSIYDAFHLRVITHAKIRDYEIIVFLLRASSVYISSFL